MNLIEQFVTETQYSRIIHESPDIRLFPKFYEANKTEITLEPGDSLFIPAGWFHWVFSETDDLNVALTFWYKSTMGLGDISTNTVIKSTHSTEIDYKKMISDLGYVVVAQSEDKFIPEKRVRNRFQGIKYKEQIMKSSDFINTPDPTLYMASKIDPRLNKYSPTIANSVDLSTARWWVNWGGGITTGLHLDFHDNWMYQLSGKKRILLFPPEDYDKLYTINPYPPYFVNRLLRS